MQKAMSPNGGCDDDHKLVKRIHVVLHGTVTVHRLYYVLYVMRITMYCRDRITKYAVR